MPDELHYWINHSYRIMKVGGAWDEFARANDGLAAIAENVTGTSLMQHIADPATRDYVQMVCRSAQLHSRPLVLVYRCDSPFLKRYMRMTVRREGSDCLLLSHRLLRSVPQSPPQTFRAVAQERAAFAVRCSICGRLKCGDNWEESAGAFKASATRGDGAVPVIYGVCSACLAHLRQRQRRPLDVSH